MQNLVQSQDAHTATDHSVTKERAIEIQRIVYKGKIKGTQFLEQDGLLDLDITEDLFKKFKKKMSLNVSIGTLANTEVILVFKNYFRPEELDILMEFAKKPNKRTRYEVTTPEVNSMSKEEHRRVKDIRRKLMYSELYCKGL